jgi:spore coat polysaccharide biosynthesis predicted glycosyltransferase SpsG
MGGVDKDNVTGRVLETLSGISLPDELEVEVILGGCSPHLESVKQQAVRMPWPTQVSIDVSDMASRMSRADLAIGAAGSSSWERCCLGLPSIAIVLAENQRRSGLALQASGAVLSVLNVCSVDKEIPGLLETILLQPSVLKQCTDSCVDVTDGMGTDRVSREMRFD